MTPRGAPTPTLPTSLDRLRLRLTAWYVGTFVAILALLGVGMFAAITRRFDQDLDASLRVATRELASAVRDRESATPTAVPAAAVRDVRIPDRSLYVTDSTGETAVAGPIEPWLQALARAAVARGAVDTTHAADPERMLRAHAERFRLASGTTLVAVAAADEIELEDRYASLIAAFGAAAVAALVLVAVGGWFLARQSTAPVERSILHMRRFMADAAHELRTPITVMRSRAEIALQRPREPAAYELALRGMERESVRLGRIVDDLLMLARADAGERPIDRKRVFLDDVVLDAAEAARSLADRKDVRLEMASFEEAPVTGDTDLLRQLVMILLHNAVKYTNAGGVVRVEIGGGVRGATLVVSDTGSGIAAEHLPHVFERFYRGDSSRTRGASQDAVTADGAGLGLSIAQWIAGEHGGAMQIESQAGQGTRVTVQFPAPVPGDSVV